MEKKKQSLGQRICDKLRRKKYIEEVGATEWLLLFIIYKYNASRLMFIKKALAAHWKEIHAKNPNFYIVWPDRCNLWEEIVRFESIGLIKISCWGNHKPYWSITQQGIKSLNSFKESVRNILGDIVDDLNRCKK